MKKSGAEEKPSGLTRAKQDSRQEDFDVAETLAQLPSSPMPKELHRFVTGVSPFIDFAKGLTPMTNTMDFYNASAYSSLANSPIPANFDPTTAIKYPGTKSPDLFPLLMLKQCGVLVSPGAGPTPTLPNVDQIEKSTSKRRPKSSKQLFNDDETPKPSDSKAKGGKCNTGAAASESKSKKRAAPANANIFPPAKRPAFDRARIMVTPRQQQQQQKPTIPPQLSLIQQKMASPARTQAPCNCKKSKCLKLYCDCFAALVYCSGCKCKDCRNLAEYESDRQVAIKATISRTPSAFLCKIEQTAARKSITGQHHKGCHCKKSNCLKKYCECFQMRILCGDRCKCLDCKNFKDSPDLLKRQKYSKSIPQADLARAGMKANMPPSQFSTLASRGALALVQNGPKSSAPLRKYDDTNTRSRSGIVEPIPVSAGSLTLSPARPGAIDIENKMPAFQNNLLTVLKSENEDSCTQFSQSTVSQDSPTTIPVSSEESPTALRLSSLPSPKTRKAKALGSMPPATKNNTKNPDALVRNKAFLVS